MYRGQQVHRLLSACIILPSCSHAGGLASAGMASPDRALFVWDAERERERDASAASSTGSGAEAGGVYRTGAVVLSLLGGVTID